MNILQSLKSLSAYPTPTLTVQDIAERAGLDAMTDASKDIRASKAFIRARAYMYIYLSEAPDVTQQGVTFSFTDEDRKRFLRKANGLLEEIGETEDTTGEVICGYIGDTL